MHDAILKTRYDLDSHVKECERTGKEIKWWVRCIGSAMLVYALSHWLFPNIHIG